MKVSMQQATKLGNFGFLNPSSNFKVKLWSFKVKLWSFAKKFLWLLFSRSVVHTKISITRDPNSHVQLVDGHDSFCPGHFHYEV